MPDFRVADTAPEHPKLRDAGLAAAGLWSLAGAYAMRELTDGWVPEYWVTTWPSGKTQATKLVQVGLWTRERRGSQPGYQFHDWGDYQRAAARFEEEREMNRERARRYRQKTGNVTRDVAGDVTHDGQRESRKTNGAVTQAPSPSPSPSPLEGHLGGETSSTERANAAQRPPRPTERCPKHRDQPTDQPCRACGEAREAVERWDRKQQLDARLAIRACQWCDAEGWRIDPANRHRGPLTPGVRCDHTPLAAEMVAS